MQSKFEQSVSRRALPGTIPGIVEEVRAILEEGSVHKVVLEIGSPIQVHKSVAKGQDLSEVPLVIDSVLANLENISEYYVDSDTPAYSFQVLVDMLLYVQSEGYFPVCWVTGTGSGALIDKWLSLPARGMPSSLTSRALPAVPTETMPSLEDDTLILCGAKFSGSGVESVEFAIKTTIELLEKDPVKAADVTLSGRNLRRVRWPRE